MWLFGRKKPQKQDQNEPAPHVNQQKEDLLVDPSLHIQGSPTDASVPYALPNNLQEVNRLDFQHYILRQALKTNYLAPLHKEIPPQSILDIGCGTGRWLAEVGSQFPGSRLVGLDQAALPEGTHFPTEGAFVQSNVLEGIPFTDASFDFVHQRLLVVALPYHSWPFIIGEILRVTRPGGWIELAETDGELHSAGPAMQQYAEWAAIALKQRGIDTQRINTIPQLLKAQNLIHVEKQTVTIPIGKWAGRLGQMAMVDLQSAQQGLKPLLMMANGITSQQYDDLLVQAHQEYDKLHTTVQYTVVYGQRPLDTSR
jgi:ubiquinone/menaquinone biosynthesis C-methylase UbiE